MVKGKYVGKEEYSWTFLPPPHTRHKTSRGVGISYDKQHHRKISIKAHKRGGIDGIAKNCFNILQKKWMFSKWPFYVKYMFLCTDELIEQLQFCITNGIGVKEFKIIQRHLNPIHASSELASCSSEEYIYFYKTVQNHYNKSFLNTYVIKDKCYKVPNGYSYRTNDRVVNHKHIQMCKQYWKSIGLCFLL